MKKFIITKIFLLIFVFPVLVQAQTFSISGKVTDSLQTPMPGINVVVVGSSIGVATKSDGTYEIENLSPGVYNLSFSAVGYERTVVENIIITNNNHVVNVVLHQKIFQTDLIVISAGKHEQFISDLPVSAEVLPKEIFSKRNIYNLENILRYVPGVSMTQDQISIRGSSGYSRGAGSRVLLTLDGIPFYTGDTGETIWEVIPTAVIKRVEVVKGASSSLYGSGAIGGVISVLTNDPTVTAASYIKTFAGGYDKPLYDEWDWSEEYRTFNGLTASHSNTFDKFGFNVSLTRLEDQSYKQSGFSKKYSGFLKGSYELTSASSLDLLINMFRKKSGNFVYWKNSMNALVPPDADQGQIVSTERDLFALTYSNVMSDNFLLTLRTSYYKTYWEDGATPVNKSNTDLFRGEVQTNYSLSQKLILVSGIESSGATVTSSLFGNPESFSVGGYSQAEYKFESPLTITAGLRYDYSKLDSLSGTSAVSPRLGLNYKISDETIIRMNAGTGFRSPTLAESFTSTTASGITVRPNPGLKSESNISLEGGISFRPFNILMTDISLFSTEYRNFIEASLKADDQGNSFIIFDNVTKARIQGFEVNTELNLFSGAVKTNLNYCYLWARDIEKNKTLKYRPRHLFSSGIEAIYNDILIGLDFRYWSKVEEIDDELVDLGLVSDGKKRVEVFLLDARAGYRINIFDLPVDLFLNANNILNYNYVELIGNLQPIRHFSLSAEVTF